LFQLLVLAEVCDLWVLLLIYAFVNWEYSAVLLVSVWCLPILLFVGVYLPLLWEPTFCWRTPLALGYTRGHFSALVPMEADLCAHLGARANIDTNDEAPTVYLPLMDYEGKILPVHFLQLSEVSHFGWHYILQLILTCLLLCWLLIGNEVLITIGFVVTFIINNSNNNNNNNNAISAAPQNLRHLPEFGDAAWSSSGRGKSWALVISQSADFRECSHLTSLWRSHETATYDVVEVSVLLCFCITKLPLQWVVCFCYRLVMKRVCYTSGLTAARQRPVFLLRSSSSRGRHTLSSRW